MSTEVALQELPTFCQKFLKSLSKRHLILLSGPLGAGKTQFVKECVKILNGASAESPTFSVINQYEGPQLIYHVDLYRMESAADIESTGFWDLFSEEALIFVEWPEKVGKDHFPRSWPTTTVVIEPTSQPDKRRLKVS